MKGSGHVAIRVPRVLQAVALAALAGCSDKGTTENPVRDVYLGSPIEVGGSGRVELRIGEELFNVRTYPWDGKVVFWMPPVPIDSLVEVQRGGVRVRTVRVKRAASAAAAGETVKGWLTKLASAEDSAYPAPSEPRLAALHSRLLATMRSVAQATVGVIASSQATPVVIGRSPTGRSLILDGEALALLDQMVLGAQEPIVPLTPRSSGALEDAPTYNFGISLGVAAGGAGATTDPPPEGASPGGAAGQSAGSVAVTNGIAGLNGAGTSGSIPRLPSLLGEDFDALMRGGSMYANSALAGGPLGAATNAVASDVEVLTGDGGPASWFDGGAGSDGGGVGSDGGAAVDAGSGTDGGCESSGEPCQSGGTCRLRTADGFDCALQPTVPCLLLCVEGGASADGGVCGAEGEECCVGSSCNPGPPRMACGTFSGTNPRCQRCGYSDQLCCSGATCEPGLSCGLHGYQPGSFPYFCQ